MFIPIESLDDPRIAVYRDLPRSNLTRPSGLFVAEGWLLVERLLASRFEIESFFLDERFADEIGPRLPSDKPVYLIPSAQVNDLLGFKFHRGVLACGRRAHLTRLADVPPPEPSSGLRVVIAAGINDPENMGCILRNSAAFGVDLIVASRNCADPFSRRVLRTSMGTVFNLTLLQPESDRFGDCLDELRNGWGVELCATVLDSTAEHLQRFTPPPRFALVFGNEGHGLELDVIGRCQRRLTIPMQRGTDSLNVGVASGIFLHHCCG